MAAAPRGAGPWRRSCSTESFLFRRKLGQQVRPVASDNAAYFVIDGSYDLEAFLDLPADQFKFLRTEGATVQEFHWHGRPPMSHFDRGNTHSTHPIVKSIGAPDVSVSGVLIAMAAEAASCLHALSICVKATAAIFCRRAPRILPESLGGRGCSVTDHSPRGR